VIITFICSNRPEDQIRVQLRFRNLADAINRTGLHLARIIDLEAFINRTTEAHNICSRSDLLVIQRYLYGPVLTNIQYWKACEKKIIVDFDQAIDHLIPEMSDYSFWMEGRSFSKRAGDLSPQCRIDPVPLEQFKWGLGMVDAATVASARLANDWSQFMNIYVMPDYLNILQYPIPNLSHEGEIRIGVSHATQLLSIRKSGLACAMEHICRENPQVKLVLCGQEAETYADLKIDPAQLILYPPHLFDKWVRLLLRLDIGLAPVSTEYELRSSSISLLEFMIAKVPWIASRQFNFSSLSRFGLWIQNLPEDWESAILKMIEHLKFYQTKAGGEPFLYALGQDASANIDYALHIYSTVVNQ
jgi:hypothetical protein